MLPPFPIFVFILVELLQEPDLCPWSLRARRLFGVGTSRNADLGGHTVTE